MNMRKTMTGLTAAFLTLFLISLAAYLYLKNCVLEALCITFGVTAYHFSIRLAVGGVLDKTLHNRVDHTRRWFQEKPFEKPLYRVIGVKKWKKFMPSYRPDYFDIKKRSIPELIGACCQAEVVHEIIMALSFLPILLSVWIQPGAVFVITSVLAAAFDGIFVILQRYNRPRLLKLLRFSKPNSHERG